MKLLVLHLVILLTAINFPQSDIEGSKDHPIISRYPGSVIVYYNEQDYNKYSIARSPVTGYREIKDWLDVEGKVTRIYYEIEANVTITQIYRNYLSALEKTGFKIIAEGLHSSSNNSKEIGGISWLGTFYAKNPYSTNANILMGAGSSSSGGSALITGQLEKAGTKVYIVIGGKEYSKNKKIYMIDIIEETTMADDLITIDADAMLKALKSDGKIALYGIYFDTDKADVKPESEPTLNEIADLVMKNPSINLYIVGHTDMQGKFDYNINLSKKRADAVVKELTERYNISKSRLTPEGVGPLAPLAANENEDGRKQNRRVELVVKSE